MKKFWIPDQVRNDNIQWTKKAITYLLLFLLCLVFFSWVNYSPSFADPDSFYHAKIAEMMSKGGVIKDFPYLQFTTLREGYIDHHFLYHVYLIPFVKILPPLAGAKIGHIILECFVVLTFFWLLQKMKVRGAFWYVLFLLFIEPFVFRLGLVKAQPISLIILFIGFYLIVNKKYFWLLLLSFLYVWSYGGWFLMFILAGIYVFTESFDTALLEIKDNWFKKIINRISKKTDFINKTWDFSISFVKNSFRLSNIKLLGSVFVGLVLGIIINPYFPKNVEFYNVHIIKIAFINYQNVIGVGSEWYPYGVNDFFINNTLPFLIAFLAMIFFLGYYKKFRITVKYAFFVFLAFVLATIKSRRNIEYLAPFAVIFGALVFSGGMDIKQIRNDLKEFKKSFIKIFFGNLYVKIFFSIVFVSLFCVVFYKMPYNARVDLNNRIDFNYLKGASEYIESNSDEGDVVFHSDWDEFPMLFFHNSKNYYIVGLDATFMYLYNSELYEKWSDVTRGKRYKEMYNIIHNDFEAKYIIATIDHEDMIRNLDNNFYFDKVYSDNEAVVFKVL